MVVIVVVNCHVDVVLTRIIQACLVAHLFPATFFAGPLVVQLMKPRRVLRRGRGSSWRGSSSRSSWDTTIMHAPVYQRDVHDDEMTAVKHNQES